MEDTLSDGNVAVTQIRGYDKLGSIRIQAEPDGSLRIEGFDGKKRVTSAHLQPGKDFTFADSTIRLPLNQPWTNGDGPGFAFGLTSVNLMLDENRNLKVLTRSGAAGVAILIPIALVTRGVALHPRLSEKEWPPGYRLH